MQELLDADVVEKAVDLKSWYLLCCKRYQDERAAENLSSQGLLCYSPKIYANKSNRAVTRFGYEPLFPGYLFIRLGENTNWTAIRSTRGVLGFVRFGMYPTVVPDEVIVKIAQSIQECEGRMHAFQGFRQGARVRVIHGCFDGLEGIYKCKSGTERSIVFLNMLNSLTEVNIVNAALEQA